MWEPRRLRTLRASTACYGNSFFTLNAQYVLSPLGGTHLITRRHHDTQERRTNIAYVNQVITLETRLARRLSDLSRPGCGTKRGDQVLSFGNRFPMNYITSPERNLILESERELYGARAGSSLH
jgi:hypothetical protein